MSQLTDIKKQAIKYLSYREHTAKELRQKLTKKFSYVESLDDVIDELSDKGYQSDLRYTIMYIEYRSRKGYGECYIQNALQQKGVSKSTIAQGFDECLVDWQFALYKLWEKKFFGLAPSDVADRCRQTRFLSSRGFAGYEINQLLSSTAKKKSVC